MSLQDELRKKMSGQRKTQTMQSTLPKVNAPSTGSLQDALRSKVTTVKKTNSTIKPSVNMNSLPSNNKTDPELDGSFKVPEGFERGYNEYRFKGKKFYGVDPETILNYDLSGLLDDSYYEQRKKKPKTHWLDKALDFVGVDVKETLTDWRERMPKEYQAHLKAKEAAKGTVFEYIPLKEKMIIKKMLEDSKYDWTNGDRDLIERQANDGELEGIRRKAGIFANNPLVKFANRMSGKGASVLGPLTPARRELLEQTGDSETKTGSKVADAIATGAGVTASIFMNPTAGPTGGMNIMDFYKLPAMQTAKLKAASAVARKNPQLLPKTQQTLNKFTYRYAGEGAREALVGAAYSPVLSAQLGETDIPDVLNRMGQDALLGALIALPIEGITMGIEKLGQIRNAKRMDKNGFNQLVDDMIASDPEIAAKMEADIEGVTKTIARIKYRLNTIDASPDFPNRDEVTQYLNDELDFYTNDLDNLNRVAQDINERIGANIGKNEDIRYKYRELKDQKRDAQRSYQDTRAALRNLERQYDENPSDELLEQYERYENALDNHAETIRDINEQLKEISSNGQQTRLREIEFVSDERMADMMDEVAREWRESVAEREGRRAERAPRQEEGRLQRETVQKRRELANEIIRLQQEAKANPAKLTENTPIIEQLRTELAALRNAKDEELVAATEQATRTSLAERLAGALNYPNEMGRRLYMRNAPDSELANPAQNEGVVARQKAEEQAVEDARLAEEQRLAEQKAREELPYDDVPIDKYERVMYAVRNYDVYKEKLQQKSLDIESELSARKTDIAKEKSELNQQMEIYIKDPDNIERVYYEYMDWVQFVAKVNALTKEGGGIKFSKGQKAPRLVQKGNVPIANVAQSLNMTVNELLQKMNQFDRFVNFYRGRTKTLQKKKMELAQSKLMREKEYLDMEAKLEELNRISMILDELSPKEYSYGSRTEFREWGPDVDPKLAEIIQYDVYTPSDKELFSTPLMEKWFPESAEKYRELESEAVSIEKQMNEQEMVIADVRQGAVNELKEFYNPSNEDILAALLVQYCRETRQKLHIYDTAEDYLWRKRAGKPTFSLKDIPDWARPYIQLRPGGFAKGRDSTRTSRPLSTFSDHVTEFVGEAERHGYSDNQLGSLGASVEIGDKVYFIHDAQLYAGDEYGAFEAALSGNPNFGVPEYRVDSRVDEILDEMGSDNPKLIIRELQKQLDDVTEKMFKVNKDVAITRLVGFANSIKSETEVLTSDADIISTIKDIKGEKVDVDKLIDEYIAEYYPESIRVDVEPIRMGSDGKPIEAPKPTPEPAVPVASGAEGGLPARTPEPAPSPVAELPARPTEPSAAPTAEMPVTAPKPAPEPSPVAGDVIPPKAEEVAPTSVPAPKPEPVSGPKPESPPTPKPSTEATKPVSTAPVDAPVNKPEFGETIRDEPIAETGAVADELPVRRTSEPIDGDGLPVNPDRVERGFNVNVRTAENTGEPLRTEVEAQTAVNELEDLVDNPNWYAQQSNMVLMNRARAFIDELKGHDKAKEYLTNKKGFISDVDNAMAQILIKHYMKKGQLNEALEVVNKIAKGGTELGRAVQAFSMWNKLDTEGILLLAQKAVDKRNARIADSKLDGIPILQRLLDEPMELTDEAVKPLLNIAENLPKIDEVKVLAKQVEDIIKNKKLGEELTPDELATLQQFQTKVNDLKGELPPKPTSDEVIKMTEDIPPRERKRDLVVAYLEALAKKAQERLNKSRNKFNANPVEEWAKLARDYAIIGASLIARGFVKFADFSVEMLKRNVADYDLAMSRYREWETFRDEVMTLVDGRGVKLAEGQRMPKEIWKQDWNKNNAERAKFLEEVDAFVGKKGIVVKDGQTILNRYKRKKFGEISVEEVAAHFNMTVDDFLRKMNVRYDPVSVDELANFFNMSVDDFLKKINDNKKPVTFTAIESRMKEIYAASVNRFRKERGLPSTTALERIVKKAIKDKNLSQDEADSLLRMATEAGFYSDEFSKELIGELQILLRNLEGSTLGRKLSSAQTIAQLLNTKTLIRNVLGNEMFYLTEKFSKLLALPIDLVLSKLTGRNREIFFFTGNQEKYWKNWLTGAKAGWQGYSPGGITTQYDLDLRVFSGKYNPLYWMEKSLGVELRSFDYAAYMRAYGEAAASWAQGIARGEGLKGAAMKERMKELIENMNDEVKAMCDDYGKYMTFQDDTLLSQAFVKAKQAMNLNQEFGMGDLVLKYPKTPANLLMRAVDFSPFGAAKALIELGKTFNIARKSGASWKQVIDKKLISESIARVTVGTMGFTMAGYMLFDVGILTGSPDKDVDMRQLKKTAGISPYQVNASALQRYVTSGFNRNQAKRQQGDIMFNYDWAQPVAVSLAVGTRLRQNEMENIDNVSLPAVSEFAKTSWEGFDAGTSTLMEQPLVQGVTRAFTTYPNTNMVDKGLEILQGLPSSFVPTALNQVRTLQDNEKRLTFDKQDLLKPFYNKVVDRLPYASRSLPTDYDSLGRPIEKYQGGTNNPFNVFLNPAFVTKYNPDPVAKEIIDLIERTGNKSPAPRVPKKSIEDINGKTIKLTPEQYSDLTKIVGTKQKEMLDLLSGPLSDKNVPDDVKIKIIESLLDSANEQARFEFKQKYGMNQVSP